MNQAGTRESEQLSYEFRPRMIGGGSAFRLGPDSLEWNVAGASGRTAYPMVTMVRLGYRPSNLGNRRFIMEIWSRNGPRLEIASASYRSPVAMDDQGPAYTAFVEALHRRIAAAGGNCRFEAGFPVWRWWPMAAVSVVAAAALVYVALQALASGDTGALVLIVAFIGLFFWQLLPLVLRNRPRRYEPHAIPGDVLPG